jgi:hypothetical protein
LKYLIPQKYTAFERLSFCAAPFVEHNTDGLMAGGSSETLKTLNRLQIEMKDLLKFHVKNKNYI